MADLRDKVWVAAVIDIKFSGEEIDTQDESKVVPEHANTHIVDCLEFYESSKKFDKALLNQFKEDFDGWSVNIFKVANKNIRRELKDRLKNSGVYVGGRGQVSDQLFHLLNCNQCPEWPADELELHLQKGNEFKSRRHNPDFDGQQEFISRTRQLGMSQSTSFKSESSFSKSAALKSESSPTQIHLQPTNSQTQPSTPPPANSYSQAPVKTIVAKVLMDLGKLYGDPEKKFGGGFYDVLDSKLRIFYDMCDKVGVAPDMYSVAYSTMLRDKAQDFYYQHLARQNYSFDVMVNKTRSYFHTPENYQAYLMEWRSTMLKSVIEAHPEKNMSECLEMVIDKLQKVHQGLVHNHNDNHSLPGQLISACQGVEACSIVLVRPASTFEGVASDLRSAIGMWMRTHTNSTRTFNSMAVNENTDENNQYYVDRRYMGNAHSRGRGGHQGGSFPRGGFQINSGHNERQQKKCFVCGKPKCWSTRHSPEERKQRRSEWRSYAQDMGFKEDLETFLVNYEGIDTEEYLDNNSDSKDFHAWLANTSGNSGSKQFDHFHTACGNINGHITANLLNNQCVMHALTGADPYDGKADEPSHLFHFQSRYDSDVFQGIMPDTGAAGISTAGENQVKALQKKVPNIEVDTSTAGQYSVRFGDNPDTKSLGTVDVKTPFGVICFAVMPSNTPFLLCLSDMDKHGVYLNNVENVLVCEHKNYPIIRKWGHPWLLLEDLEGSMVWCHMTEAELRQLHRRFGHPAVERLYKVLQRAGYNDLELETIAKITKYCHQCQMHGGAPGRFRFTLHDDIEFNYRIVIDVMYINSRPVLHAVDEATSFQAARFLTNITAKATWDTLRAMWIDMYVGPPDVIVTDAGKNFTAVEFRANAHAMAVKVEEVPVESHNSIGKAERYHYTLKRAYEVISADLGITVTSEDALQMAVKAVNDTAGPHGLVPTLLVFGTYPRLTESSPPSPSITVRANAIRKAMTEVRKLKATRQVADGLSMRNGPNIIETIQLPLQSEVKVWRENIGWTGPHILLARSDNDVTCTVDVNGKVLNFRTVSVKPYHRDETTVTRDGNDSVDGPAEDGLNEDEEYRSILQEEQPQRKRGRPKGSKNALKSLAVGNATDSIWMTEKEKLDAALALKLRQEGKITTPGRPFEESDRLEIEALIGRGVFRFEKLDPQKHGEVRIFKSRMVREIKGKTTGFPYEKSRLVIQGYNDDEKHMVLTQSPTIQRASQRIIMALAPSLLKRQMHLWLRDITQAYVQSHTTLQRTVLAHLPKQIRDNYPANTIMVVIKPLYGIAEAGAHWWATYFKHHCERLHMVTSSYDPCLLMTTNDSGYFGVVGMQTDDTLGISDAEFAAQENNELQKAKFLAKEKQFLDLTSPLLFNGCILSMQADNILLLRQKNQGERLKLVTNNLEYIEQRARGAYLATICQPEASFDLSAAAQHKEPSNEDIARLNKRIAWQISNVGRGLTYIPLDISTMRLFVFVDGSFANNKDMSSQIGFVIVLANEEVTDESFTITGSIVHWSSTKCKRITRSVLASEIYAMANGVDMAISINTTINKIVAQLGESEISLVVCTDSFSLYECLVKLGTTKEKRLMIDIMALRQAYEQQEVGDIRWINGADNPADAMTKSNPNRALETLINDNKLTMRVQGWVKRSLETERI